MRLLFIIGLLFCQECKAQNQDLSIFEKFHSFFEKQQYDSIAPLLSENFILINELGKTVSNKKEYLNQFNTWDKAFNTKWVVTSVASINGKVVSTEHDMNAFNKYIYPWPMEYKFTYTILQNQLIQLQYDTLPGSKYYQNKDAGNYYSGRFYYWLQRNHPLDKTFLVEETYPAALRTKELFEVFLKSEK